MKTDYRKVYGQSELLDTFLNQSAGEVIRDIRIEKGLSLNQVASKTNMFTKQTLSKYELGKSKLRMNVFLELAKIYDIEPKDLYARININYMSKLEKHLETMKEID